MLNYKSNINHKFKTSLRETTFPTSFLKNINKLSQPITYLH